MDNVCVYVCVQLPEPIYAPRMEQAKFGFTEYAERINSRYAMIGFFALLAVEGIFNVSILSVLGIEVGNGIDLPL